MDSKCKICRRAGEKLFLKGDRCFTPKCAVARKPYPPGVHTRPSRRGLSEFGMQLREKQKLRNLYQIREAQFSNYVHKAMASKGADAADALLQSLALRLDNMVFQAGFAQSRSVARQVVSHGHARVNGRKTTIPSYALRVGDTVTLSDRIWKSAVMKNIEPVLQKYVPPAWIILDGDRKTATISAHPETKDQVSFNTKLIIEYYAR
ncbi:MAG: small subunit ribosomal protein S4 [Parcubacteria group bacterium Gr01-1014_29]|nr:MAG: small subunit ribosomal protein S4 [Parcubacteria group bacterium Gr01-1014_29]